MIRILAEKADGINPEINLYANKKRLAWLQNERHDDNIFEGWLKQFRDMLKMRPYVNYTVVHDNPPEYMKHLQTGADLGNSRVISYAEFEKELTPS